MERKQMGAGTEETRVEEGNRKCKRRMTEKVHAALLQIEKRSKRQWQ